jgi:hypothetical protein
MFMYAHDYVKKSVTMVFLANYSVSEHLSSCSYLEHNISDTGFCLSAGGTYSVEPSR